MLPTGDPNSPSSMTPLHHLLTPRVLPFPMVSVVHLLMDFLSADGAGDVIRFVREIVESYPSLRESILSKLISLLSIITDPDVIRSSLWILGEFCSNESQCDALMDTCKALIGPMPLDSNSTSNATEPVSAPSTAAPEATGPKINKDGTYAYESSLSVTSPGASNGQGKRDLDKLPVIRRLLVNGDYFLGSCIGATLTKLSIRCLNNLGGGASQGKGAVIYTVTVIAGIVNYGKSSLSPRIMEDDNIERLILCIRSLLDPSMTTVMSQVWLSDCRGALHHLLHLQKESKPKGESGEGEGEVGDADSLIHFRQLRLKKGILGSNQLDLDDAAEISKATEVTSLSDFSEKLNRTYQLTGSGDPVYAEAHVMNHDYDIVLDILVMNRTPLTLTNLSVDLATKGPLKIVERPSSYTLAPGASLRTKVTIKVSSTETSNIFGNIVFDTTRYIGSMSLSL